MIFSKALLATDKKGTKLNWWEYWIGHCWMTGWQTIGSNFRIWGDLLGSNYEGYAVFPEDDSEKECIDWFWVSLIADDVYPKEFLEELMQMAEDVRTGKVETVPMNEVMDKLKEMIEIDEKMD